MFIVNYSFILLLFYKANNMIRLLDNQKATRRKQLEYLNPKYNRFLPQFHAVAPSDKLSSDVDV